jgi:ribosomal protein L15E
MKAALSKKELCQLYNISGDTLRRWFKIIQLDTGHRNILTPVELNQVFTEFGNPTDSRPHRTSDTLQ